MSAVTRDQRSSVLQQLRNVLAWRDVRILCILFLFSQALDVATTQRALRNQGLSEGNPWLAEQTHAHPFLVYGAKLFCAVLVILALLLLRLRWRLRLMVLAVFVGASLIAPVNNLLRIAGWI